MKKLLFTLFLAGCGDNIIPAVDAGLDAGRDWWVEPEGSPDFAMPDAGVDAPPDAPLPVCDDRHIAINGHQHKCRHNKK